MKKKELERWLRRNGWRLLRQGGSHEQWTDGINVVSILRHSELKENMARGIMKGVLLDNMRR